MGSWASQLAGGIREALLRGSPCRVAVHMREQIVIGEFAVHRLADQTGGNANHVTFEVISSDEQDRYPVGAILSS